MNNGIRIFFSTLALLFLFLALTTVGMARPPSFVSDEILVKFRPGADIANIHAVNRTKTLRVIPGINVHVVSTNPGQNIQDIIERLKKNRNVEYAEPNYMVELDFIPNDPEFNKQWGLHNTGQTRGTPDADIDAPEAWDTEKGNSGVVIAILDTGIKADHPDLSGKVVHQENFSDSTGTEDVYGHGTHVAGIAAASTNNRVGVAGVGFNCSLMNVKVINDSGNGNYAWVANGIIYAADNGAKVINMSLGGPLSQTIEDAVNYAWGKNVVVVASAGNNGNSEPRHPAYCGNCIAVAATDHKDAKADFSTYGDWVDVAAPGVSIYSTILPQVSKKSTVYYGYMSGTSMSAPHVAGLAGLIWSKGYTSNNDVRCQILGTADKISGTGTYWVWGRINAHRAFTETVDIHDLAIIGVSAPNRSIVNNKVDIGLTVQNQGNNSESSIVVSLKDKATGNIISTDTITGLPAGGSIAVNMEWIPGTIGDYTLIASIAPLTDELDTADNSKQFVISVVNDGTQVMKVSGFELSFSERKIGKNSFVRAVATVTVSDSTNSPVSSANVDGHWGRATTNTSSGLTDENGVAVLLSDEVKNPASGTIFTFWVDNVTKEGYIYDKPADPLVKSITYTKAAPQFIPEYETALGNAYPNPGNPDVWIPFTLSDTQHVLIKIYDSSGKLVRSLDLGEKPIGAYLNKDKAAYWNGQNDSGEQVTSGIYFYTIQAGDYMAIKKMILMK